MAFLRPFFTCYLPSLTCCDCYSGKICIYHAYIIKKSMNKIRCL
ncbi:hypothetical protein DESPIG_02811 [Desulfovibrio piger ATCC 29098]|uniref:Uncharacterized protein n=1 Tax=Desulfovibrio piger ATCC 29098 TaxID=411464 RepID=B6WXI4_9BACT|nr:hypothetical protein DESPIG_02811 [Desulfovibrio piger ATCC 29098]